MYGKLLRNFSMQAGLTETEADEVVQETAIAVSRHLPGYTYDPKVCRFKTWLLNQASWRIRDQLKKRRREKPWELSATAERAAPAPADDTARTATINRVPDPAAKELDALFETDWRKSLFGLALEQVRQKFTLKQFQVFDLLVVKEWKAAEVAQAVGMTLANVYVTRHRFSAALKAETKRLEREWERKAAEARERGGQDRQGCAG